MGCGKSHIGKRLAKKLGSSFIDLDEYLEEKEGKLIKEIFQTEGEDYFRRKEKEYLREMNQFANTIIATGGGTPCFFDNGDWMNKNGITLYLQTPIEVIFQQLKKGRENRPLVLGFNDKVLRDFIQKKLKEREVYYQNVHLVYKRQEGGDEVVKELADYFSMFK